MATNNAWNDSVLAANVTFNGGTMSIGTDATDNAINIGTAAGAGRTTTVGNTTSASALALSCGTGGFALTSATGTIINALSTGETTRPLQTAFLAFLPSSVTNATGNTIPYQMGATTALTIIFDQNSDFNTNGTLTAPITARYQLMSNITYVCNNSTGGTEGYTILRTSNRDYYSTFTPTRRRVGSYFGPSSALGFLVTTLADLDAADTAIVFCVTDGGSANSDTILGDATLFYTYFSGHLAV